MPRRYAARRAFICRLTITCMVARTFIALTIENATLLGAAFPDVLKKTLEMHKGIKIPVAKTTRTPNNKKQGRDVI